MKHLKQGLCLGLLAAGLVVVPTLQAQAGAPAAAGDRSIVDRLRAEADGTVSLSREPATGKIGFARVTGARADLMPGRAADSATTAAAKADAYLADYAAAFGAGAGELVRVQVQDDALGWTVSYRQSYRGVDVFGAMVRANLDRAGNLRAVNGYAAPDLDLSVAPDRSADQAGAAAVAAVKADPPGHDGDADTTGVEAVGTKLVVYRTGVASGDVGKAVLAYVVEVSNGSNVRDMVFIDARTGKVVNRYSLLHDALDRKLYESNPTTTPVWQEGDAFPGTLSPDQQNLVQASGESYWFFKNAFGRDSYDANGATMKTVNNDPRINCPNANWNGVTTNYCNGVTSDDVVAHEWGHAYTEYTWDGIYQWQPGALNESYSDIWGETVDLINGRQDSDEGDITTPRPVGQCSTHSSATPVVVINSPQAIAKNCEAGAAQFGPQLTGTGITGNVVVASAPNACSALTNGAAITGNIALVDRGTCGFAVKVKNAQNAGATAVLVADNVEATPSPMGGSDSTITIPSVRIRLSDGNTIKSALTGGQPVNVTMKDAAGDRVDSYRWLMGEDSTAFGGAIRDMWQPNCYGDPGKVSDAQYYCATDDGGGVHSNSGVPNHGYALLVDGGTYNGTTVTGLGLDKAAAIYFRAMTQYQTPTTDFADHADALAASCTDLVGAAIKKLSTATNPTPVAATPITAADCTQVANVIAAVELRKAPVQCNFQPLLKQGAQPLSCGNGFTTSTVFSEGFEDGLTGWEKDSQIVFAGGGSLPWQADSTAPGNHPGGVARGVGTGEGNCSSGAGDLSSRDSITSPAVSMPAAVKSPRLVFDHYVATEAGFDGGNVKVSINEGAFTLVPTAAYTFNKPNATIDPTSPLAGEEAFSGTDGGELGGSWGQSQIDLSQLGVKAGDQLRFRFDMGRDGCGGNDGWYVDNVKVELCTPKGTPPVPPVPPTGPVASETGLKIKPKSLNYKEDFRAVVQVVTEGVVPTGVVKLFANRKKIGKGVLKDGKVRVVIRVEQNLKPGKYKFVAKYLGSSTANPSQDTLKKRIQRSLQRVNE